MSGAASQRGWKLGRIVSPVRIRKRNVREKSPRVPLKINRWNHERDRLRNRVRSFSVDRVHCATFIIPTSLCSFVLRLTRACFLTTVFRVYIISHSEITRYRRAQKKPLKVTVLTFAIALTSIRHLSFAGLPLLFSSFSFFLWIIARGRGAVMISWIFWWIMMTLCKARETTFGIMIFFKIQQRRSFLLLFLFQIQSMILTL